MRISSASVELLEQVRGLRARLDFDAFAFAQAGQGLQRLANEDDAALCFLPLGKKSASSCFADS